MIGGTGDFGCMPHVETNSVCVSSSAAQKCLHIMRPQPIWIPPLFPPFIKLLYFICRVGRYPAKLLGNKHYYYFCLHLGSRGTLKKKKKKSNTWPSYEAANLRFMLKHVKTIIIIMGIKFTIKKKVYVSLLLLLLLFCW